MKMEDIQICVLDDSEYNRLLDNIENVTGKPEDDFAFSFNVGDKHVMVIRGERIEQYPPYVHKAVVAHELAHLHGIKDEEEADIWALRYLDDIFSRKFLIDNWEYRHGHRYEYDIVDDYTVYMR